MILMNKRKRRRIVPLAVLIVLVLVCVVYLSDYYPAAEDEGVFGNVMLTTENGLMYFDGPGEDSALIFYPGGKVEYSAYTSLMNRLAESGVDCFLVDMPANLAFFGVDKADEIIETNDYNKWFIGGHSLGGVAASMYAGDHDLDGLILLASYPTEEIDEPVLSVYGSEDGVLDMEKYEDAKKLLPDGFTEVVIAGGNHAQFGNYGEQDGDGTATVTADQQQDETVNAIIEFIGANN